MIWSGFWGESDGNLPFPCLMVRNCVQFFSVFKLFWVDNVVRVYLKQATNQGWALHARAYPEWHHQLLGKMPGPLVDSELSWLQSKEALKPGMNQEAATEKTYFTAFSSLLAVSPSNFSSRKWFLWVYYRPREQALLAAAALSSLEVNLDGGEACAMSQFNSLKEAKFKAKFKETNLSLGDFQQMLGRKIWTGQIFSINCWGK